jgi:hypothetical protein
MNLAGLRTCLAFALAPLVPALLFAFVFSYPPRPRAQWSDFLAPFTWFSIIAYAAEAFLGIPAWIVRQRMGWTSYGATASVGVVVGVATGVLLYALLLKNSGPHPVFLLFPVAGALGAFAFRCVEGQTPIPAGSSRP